MAHDRSLTDGTVAKAYSLWQLNHHEIVRPFGLKPDVIVIWGFRGVF
jgi:hypothetical protein